MLRHVVAVSFKPEASAQQVADACRGFADLERHIPAVKAVEWGVNVSPEDYHKGLTHLFLLTFHSESGRDAYFAHEAHLVFQRQLSALVDDVFVIDYWVRK